MREYKFMFKKLEFNGDKYDRVTAFTICGVESELTSLETISHFIMRHSDDFVSYEVVEREADDDL